MSKDFDPARLDLRAFAEVAARLAGHDALARYPRLAAEAAQGEPVQPSGEDDAGGKTGEGGGSASAVTVNWQAHGEARARPVGAPAIWLHLRAETTLPLICQRCLAPAATPLQVDRWFRFVADEATAAAEDEEAEEDVLVISRDFDLRALIEDELLMAIPVAPRHVVCPTPPRLAVADADFDADQVERPNPFAALDKLRNGGKAD